MPHRHQAMTSNSAIIDLTSDSPPTTSDRVRSGSSSHAAPPRRTGSTLGDAGVSRAGSSSNSSSAGGFSLPGPSTIASRGHSRAQSSSRSTGSPSARSRTHVPTSSRSRAAPVILLDDDTDDDDDIQFVGMSAEAERIRSESRARMDWQRTFLDVGRRRGETPQTAAEANELPPNMNIHEGLHRGPHGRGSATARGPPYYQGLDMYASAQLAFPALNASNNRNRGVRNPALQDALFGFANRMDFVGALMRNFHGYHHFGATVGMGGAQPNANKMPDKLDPKVLHPKPVLAGFSTDVIEPPVDLETYFDDKAKVTGPLPDTTPVCPCCQHALVLGGSGKQRMWVLPCGHMIDGRCMARVSGIPLPPDEEQAKESGTDSKTDEADTSFEADTSRQERHKGKAKATDSPEDEPPAKSTRSRSGKARTSLPKSPPKKPRSKRFVCPVEGCDQQCKTGTGSELSCIEVFV